MTILQKLGLVSITIGGETWRKLTIIEKCFLPKYVNNPVKIDNRIVYWCKFEKCLTNY